MQFRKIVISLTLLLAYSVGLTHNLSPYCNYGDSGDVVMKRSSYESFHAHEHHQHKQNNATSHEHFIHEGHYDTGVFDFIVCLLSESENIPCEVDHFYNIPVNSDDTSPNWLTNAKFAATLLVIFRESDQEKVQAEFNSEVQISYLSPEIGDSPYRGPPSHSC